MNHYPSFIFKHKIILVVAGLILSVSFFPKNAHASTLDEIQALEADKGALAQASTLSTPVPDRPATSGRTYPLPDGRQINVADYRIVLFMQGGCHYCQQFDPQLAQLSAQTGFNVFPYTLDGQGDASFPAAIPAPRAVLDQFFGPGNNGVTPTTFLVNVNTLQSWPLAQGITDMNTLMQRVSQALMN